MQISRTTTGDPPAVFQSSDRYILFHRKRHPSEMAEAEVAAFLTHLANVRGVSASTQNQALAALLFLYRHVLSRELGSLPDLVWAKRSEHVPVVLTRDEVVTVLAELSGTVWLIAALLYGAGLRLTECLELRVKDIEIASHQIVVREGKGGRDRRTASGEYRFRTRWRSSIHVPVSSGNGGSCFPPGGSVETRGGGRRLATICTSRSFSER